MCGMMRKEDIACAASLGVDAIGLIFAPKSPRCLTLSEAKKLLEDLPVFLNVVAVLSNPRDSFVQDILKQLPVNYLQFHGQESPEFCEQFDKPYLKAISVKSAEELIHAEDRFFGASALLLDNALGGTGQTFDWDCIPSLKRPFILAGGLNEHNVAQAAKKCNPFAVDVSSGIEKSPGIKDHKKMCQFVAALWSK